MNLLVMLHNLYYGFSLLTMADLSLFTLPIIMSVSFGLIVTVVILIGILKKLKAKILELETQPDRNESAHHFRKRDKMMFYGKKLIRKVSYSVGDIKVQSRKIKRRLSIASARMLLDRKTREVNPMLLERQPPLSVLEADTQSEHPDSRIPPEVLLMLKSVQVFGHFDRPLFLDLCRHCESKFIPSGVYLFKPGQPDNSIFVVQSGHLKLYITDTDGRESFVKDVYPGDTIHSLLSVLDVVTGLNRPYKTVSSRAMQDTTVLCLSAAAFSEVFRKYPESLVRLVQIIMIRLQRVTMLALRNYLGLSNELISQTVTTEGRFGVQSLSHQTVPSANSPKDRSGSERDSDSGPGGFKVTQRHSYSEPDSDFELACGRARVSIPTISGKEMTRMKSIEEKPAMDTAGVRHITLSDEQLLEMAMKDLSLLLELDECADKLSGKVILVTYHAGTVVAKQGDTESNLVFIVAGQLSVHQVVEGSTHDKLVYVSRPGDLEGALAVLTGEPQLFSCKSKMETKCAVISKDNFYALMRENPLVVLPIAHYIVSKMSPFVRQIDFALDWMQIEAGRPVYKQNEMADSIYLVLNGRLRSVFADQSGKKRLLEEHGRGDLVGLVEVLTQKERATSVHAVRDTEMAKLPAGLVNFIKKKQPQVVTQLIHLLGQRILRHMTTPNTSIVPSSFEQQNQAANFSNLSTVAVIPASSSVAISAFSLELTCALDSVGPALRLTSNTIRDALGPHALSSLHEYKLSSWLGQQEDMHRIVLYQADLYMSPWTRQCIRQADCILIVANATETPDVGDLESQLERLAVRAQKELILLHKEWEDPILNKPHKTAEWLNRRVWCTSHHHIRCAKRVFSKKSEAKLAEYYRKLFDSGVDIRSDFSRLSRFLTGTSVGLVLGGGGARGISQVGIIKAMTEVGIPIDMVGGTSIGSFMGGLYAQYHHSNIDEFIDKARVFSSNMTSILKRLLDLTYPITSFFTGAQFNNGIHAVFGDQLIEDLWIPYFCITTDISASQMRVHTSGSLWRYVRSSMSLAGYFPPLCDPKDGHYLLDGGYVNNLPADVMRSFGCKTVIAVDVGSIDEVDFYNYGDSLSGWWLLWKRWNPFAAAVKIPDFNDIQSRLTYVSCVRQLEDVKATEYCKYVRPPIDRFKLLQFGSFDDIYYVGYTHGQAVFESWIAGKLVDMKQRNKLDRNSSVDLAQISLRFTDLSAVISSIDHPSTSLSTSYYSYSDDTDDEDLYRNRNRGDPQVIEEDEDEENMHQYNARMEDDAENYLADYEEEDIPSNINKENTDGRKPDKSPDDYL